MAWTHSTVIASERTFWCFLRVLLLSISAQKWKKSRSLFHGNLLKKIVYEYLTLLEVNIILSMFLYFKCIALSILIKCNFILMETRIQIFWILLLLIFAA